MCEGVLYIRSELVVFFCFKQKTAYELRISDWSSDVCSSDLRFVSGFVPRIDELGAKVHHLVLELLLLAREPAPCHARRQVRGPDPQRSEERRVGKAGGSTGRSRWSPDY